MNNIKVYSNGEISVGNKFQPLAVSFDGATGRKYLQRVKLPYVGESSFVGEPLREVTHQYHNQEAMEKIIAEYLV